MPFSIFASVHDLGPWRLLGDLVLTQAVIGQVPEPLVVVAGHFGEMLLPLTPRPGSFLPHLPVELACPNVPKRQSVPR